MGAPVKPLVGTKGEYARHRGCSAAYVSKLIRLGKLAEPALMADGRVNFVLADQMVGSSEPEPVASAVMSGPNYAVERARREAAQAALAEMDLELRQGALLRRDAIEQAATSVFGRAMARFSDAWPDLSVELAAMTDPGAIAQRLADQQRAVMAAINREFLEDAARRSAA